MCIFSQNICTIQNLLLLLSPNWKNCTIENRITHSANASKSPWWWVPTLYFVEGVPYVLVNTISVALFAKFGVPNDQLAFFTTLLYFPWFLKGLWSPIVDVVKTKRWWIIAMQILMTVLCALLVVTLPHPDAALIAEKQTPVSIFWLTLVLFIITAFASATHDIAADGYYMLAQPADSQARFVGIRSTFYRIATIFGQGGLVAIAGIVENKTDNIPLSWQAAIGAAAVILCLTTLYHLFALPKVEGKNPTSNIQQITTIVKAFSTFFTKPGAWLAILFMLLYRLPEGLLVKLSFPFLIDSQETTVRDGQIFGGGLGLSTLDVSIIYGVFGVAFLLLGGILGGIYISRRGLKQSLWLMAGLLTIPNLVYVYLSAAQPTNLWIIGSAISLEQFGYGFGFTAYMMYMMHFSQSENSVPQAATAAASDALDVSESAPNYATSHYAICTAFMALSMMLPGFVAGKIELAVGYNAFFWIAIACSITTIIVTYFVRQSLIKNDR